MSPSFNAFVCEAACSFLGAEMLRALGSLKQFGSHKSNGDAAADNGSLQAVDENAEATDGAPVQSREPRKRERGQITLRRSESQAYQIGSQVWVPEKGLDQALGKQRVLRWVKGVVESSAKDAGDKTVLTVRTEEGAVREHKPDELPLQNERDDTVDDLVKSDFLHEPG